MSKIFSCACCVGIFFNPLNNVHALLIAPKKNSQTLVGTKNQLPQCACTIKISNPLFLQIK